MSELHPGSAEGSSGRCLGLLDSYRRLSDPDDSTSGDRQDISAERENRLRSKYPFHIYLMVKAAAKALDAGRAGIRDGILIVQPPKASTAPRSKVERP